MARPGDIFVGRERELTQLLAGLGDALAGRGRLFLISGEPGIGKSRLAEELAGQARQRGAQVLVGRCWEAGGAPAFWPWVQTLRGYLRGADMETLRLQLGQGASDLAQILPEIRELFSDLPDLPSLEPEGARFRLFDAAASFLRHVARAQSLVLVLDDLHAADTSSLLLLQFVAGELATARILILCAYRDVDPTVKEPLSLTLAELTREPVTRLLSLAGLEQPDVARFIDLTAGLEPPESVVADIHRETEGNPLFVGEVVRLLASEGRLTEVADGAPSRLTIPDGVRAVIGRRLRHLSDACRRVLALASVLGRDFALDALERVSELSSVELLGILDEAIVERVIIEAPGGSGRLRFSHALIRDTLYDELPASRRLSLHRQIGEALESLYEKDTEPHLAELAHHFFLAAPGGGDDRAVDYARRAGDRAVTLLAYEEAVRLYGTALEALGDGGDEQSRCELLLALGGAEARSGDGLKAKATFLDAASIARRLQAPEQLALAALGYGGRFLWARAGTDRHLVPLLDDALAALGKEDSPLRVRLLTRLAGALRDQHEREPRASLSREAVDMARRLGDPATLAYALDGRYTAIFWPENPEERMAISDELVRVAEEIGELERAAEGHYCRAMTLLELGDIPALKESLEAYAALTDELRQPAQRWLLVVTLATLALFEGRFEEGEALLSEALALGQRAQSSDAVLSHRIQLFTLRRLRGGLEAVEELIRRSIVEYPARPMFRCMLASLHAEQAHAPEARRLFEELAADDFAALPLTNEWLFSMGFLAEVAEFLGDAACARVMYELLLPYAGRNAMTADYIATGSVSRPLGILASMLSRWVDAESHFEAAIEMNARMGARPWLAHTQCDYAQMLRARAEPGDSEQAAELLRAALASARELGLEPLAAKASALLSPLEPVQVSPEQSFAGYRLEALAGRGGMGLVYRATDLALERPVALKLIAPELAQDEDFRVRFLREARLAASLDHPHILPVHAAGEAEGQLYLAMRYVEGEDLRALLARERRLAPERALALVGQLAEALDAAHARGLLHRDVKPANVLLDQHGNAYLADFGLSKRTGADSTQTGQLVGTLDYLAPEQIRGETLDGRADQYALACLLYECLAGEPPFRRASEAQTLWAHMHEPPPSLPELPQLAPVLARALAKEAEERYGSCTAFVAAAGAALGVEPRPLRARRRRRRGRRLLLAGALLVALAATATGIELTRGGGPVGLASVAPDSLAGVDPATNRIVAQIPVGAGPVAVGVGEGAVWVANAAEQTVSRVDPKTKRVVATIGTGRTPSALAVGDGAVWIANAVGGTGTVSQLEPQSNEVVGTTVVRKSEEPDLFAPPTPSAIAVGEGRVWTNNNPRSRISSLSPSLQAKPRSALLGRTSSVDGIAVGEGAVWVTSSADDTVLRLDPGTGRVTTTIRIAAAAGKRVAGPYGIVLGDGSVWVADSLANAVSRIDPRLRAVIATIPVGRRPTSLAAGEGAIWVLNRGDGSVSRIDPSTNAVTSTIHVGERLTGIAAGAGAVWVSVAGGSAALGTVSPPRLAEPLPTSSCSSLVYGGPGRPRFLIASDLPRLVSGQPSRVTAQMNQAIRLVLEQRRFRAGRYTVGFQSCDDSTAPVGGWDPAKCAANAKAFAADASVIGVIGAYNSGCTGVELPVTNASRSGPLATISPANTYVGLTRSGPATTAIEPDEYYPTGVRSYVRVAGNDEAQGAADAILARELGLRRIYLLDDGTGTAVADVIYTRRALLRLGVRVVGQSTWSVAAKQYVGLARKLAGSRPDGVYIGGCICSHGGRLLRDLRAALGRHVTFFAPDNFGADGVFYGRGVTVGLYMSQAGQPIGRLGSTAGRFAAVFRARYGRPIVALYAIEAAQAAEVLLGAIARSDGSRASVTNGLLASRVEGGLLGSLRFDANGDPTRSPVAIYRVPPGTPKHRPPFATIEEQGGVLDRVILAQPSLARP